MQLTIQRYGESRRFNAYHNSVYENLGESERLHTNFNEFPTHRVICLSKVYFDSTFGPVWVMMETTKQLLGEQNIVTYKPSLDKSTLGRTNDTRQHMRHPVCNEFSNAFIYGVAAGNWPKVMDI